MHYHTMSNEALLEALIGKETATAVYTGKLRPLFEARDAATDDLAPLCVARELVKRWLVEEMQAGDVLASPSVVKDYLLTYFSGQCYESFVTLYLDAQNRVILAEESFRGTLTQTSVYPREIVRRALALNAGAVLLAHNHPSGLAEPSRADEYLTTTLKTALGLVDVRVLDHLVVAGPKAVSFAERGLL